MKERIAGARSTDKPVCFVLSFVAFVTQAWKATHSAITENMENTLMKHTPQRLIIGKPISQYASYSAIGKEQHENHLTNPSSHYGEYTRETRAPYLDTLKP